MQFYQQYIKKQKPGAFAINFFSDFLVRLGNKKALLLFILTVIGVYGLLYARVSLNCIYK